MPSPVLSVDANGMPPPICSVLWMPPGATRFCSRQAWRKQVAYASRFESPADRAYRGQAKIKSRLIGNCDPPTQWLGPYLT